MEEFVQIKEYPDYLINRSGVIKRASKLRKACTYTALLPERLIVPQRLKSGLCVNLWDSNSKSHFVSVSKLVLQTFGPNKGTSDQLAGHKDSDKFNVHIDNLVWMTRKEVIETYLRNRK